MYAVYFSYTEGDMEVESDEEGTLLLKTYLRLRELAGSVYLKSFKSNLLFEYLPKL